MDAMCILDAGNGGRCACSNKNKEFDAILAEIERIDSKTYQMATAGVEILEAGIAPTTFTSAVSAARRGSSTTKKNSDDYEPVREQTGDEILAAADRMCMARVDAECAGAADIIRGMYMAKIASDCRAYENALNARKKESESKLQAAETAIYSASREAYETANKYDLGQCVLEFKSCMMGTAGCGADWSGCVGIAAAESATDQVIDHYSIDMSESSVMIAMSTYDALDAKRTLCQSVLNQCQKVQDQVFGAFLREIAPAIQLAELHAESNMRQSCISNISECFVRACHDNIDPKDPDGSYNACLSRPELVQSFCRVYIEPCMTSTDGVIWEGVLAKLASMRVDACTNDVKSCLMDANRCGDDYAGCIGLDTNTIIRMCPYDKLTGCQLVYADKDIQGEEVYTEIARLVEGLMLNIDNSMLAQCQAALDESMVRVCGSVDDCLGMTNSPNIGTRSLEYKICEYTISKDNIAINYDKCRNSIDQVTDAELGRVYGATSEQLGDAVPLSGILDGTMYWELVEFDSDGHLTSADDYLAAVDDGTLTDRQKNQIRSELGALQGDIDNAIRAIESDATVQFCMTGRQVPGMKDIKIGEKTSRFPKLSAQVRRIVALRALKVAKDNYYAKYDQQLDKMIQDRAKIAERQAEIKGENGKDAKREAARQACIDLAPMSALPKSPNPPKGIGAWIVLGVAVLAAVVGSIVTFGAGALLAGCVLLIIVAPTVGAVGIATGIATLASKQDKQADVMASRELSSQFTMNQWNYKEIITTEFNWEEIQCTKCVRTMACESAFTPAFGAKRCKHWGPMSEEKCETKQY